MSKPYENAYFVEKKALLNRRYSRRKEVSKWIGGTIIATLFMGLAYLVLDPGVSPILAVIFPLIFLGLIVTTFKEMVEAHFDGKSDEALLHELELEQEREYQMLLARAGGKGKHGDETYLRLDDDGEMTDNYDSPFDDTYGDDEMRLSR